MSDQNQKKRKYSGWEITMMVLTCIAWAGWLGCRLTVGGACVRPETASNFV